MSGRSHRRGVRPAHLAQYALLRAVGGVLSVLPPDAASSLMGRLLGGVMRRSSRHGRAKAHLAMAMPELTEAEREATARAMWRQLGRVAGEAFHIGTLMRDETRFEVPPDYEALRVLAKDGAVLATLHMGNWEIAGGLVARAGLPLAGVYQAIHNPLADRYVRRLRSAVYPAGLHSKGPRLGARLVSLARGGAGVGIVADLREKRGVGVSFFGQPAFATPLPAMLARLSGRPLIAAGVMRTQGVHFRVLARPIDVAVTDDRQADIARATQAVHDVFEGWIRQAPEQWMWTHRKWATSATRALTVATLLDPGEADAASAQQSSPS